MAKGCGLAAIVIVALAFFAALLGPPSHPKAPPASVSEGAKPEMAAAPSAQTEANIPGEQRDLVTFVNEVRQVFQTTHNAMARKDQKRQDEDVFCGLVDRYRDIKLWTGVVEHVFANQLVAVDINFDDAKNADEKPIEMGLKFNVAGAQRDQLLRVREGDKVLISGRIETERMVNGGCAMLFLNTELQFDLNAEQIDFAPLLIPVIPTALQSAGS